ncbi:hypothetical protein B0H14DRAFT_3442922 [Mycena olivaceomarginata]|nr:hypothetical protein B0H14DRAFT_3442922 [Mycena olivaceomarginata]
MTLHGLRAFAEHCKALKFLAIIVDGFTVPLLDDSPQTRIPQRQLCSFDVAKSPISDARTVSRFLSSLFPDLSEIRTHDKGFWEDRHSDDEDEETTAYVLPREDAWLCVDMWCEFAGGEKDGGRWRERRRSGSDPRGCTAMQEVHSLLALCCSLSLGVYHARRSGYEAVSASASAADCARAARYVVFPVAPSLAAAFFFASPPPSRWGSRAGYRVACASVGRTRRRTAIVRLIITLTLL